jgi:CRP-like cAMP-binding protein
MLASTPEIPSVKRDNKSSFFDIFDLLDQSTRDKIEAAWKEVAFAPQEIICAQGSPPEAVYIVMSGIVESVTYSPDSKQSRLVAVMSRGDFFGDLSVFTLNPRLATVRAREASQILRIERDAFLRLLRQIPELGVFFSFNLARRLHATSTEAHHHVYAIDLTGNLQRFDLLTIVQAITSMGHTGELRLNNSANELLGSFFFRHGRVEHARFGHLLGIEAIWQGFVESASDGSFNFRSITEPTAPYPEQYKIDIDSTNLLLTGVGKRDVYQALPLTLRRMKGDLIRKVPALEWKDDESRELANQIWAGLSADQPRKLTELWRAMNCSAMSFLEVVMELGMSGQAELLVRPDEIDEE